MKDLNDYVNGNDLEAADFNQIPSEIQNAITDSGQTLSSGDTSQLSKAIGSYTRTNKADAVLHEPINGKIYHIGGTDGGTFRGITGAALSTYSDNGGTACGTVFIPTGGDGSSAYLRDYSGVVNVKWFGAKLDFNGVTGTDDTTALQLAANFGGKLIGGGGNALISSTLTIDIQKVTGIDFLGGSIEAGANITDIVKIYGYPSDGYENATFKISSLHIKNKDSLGKTVNNGILYDGASTAGAASHIQLDNVIISNTLVAETYTNNAYIIKGYGGSRYANGTAIKIAAGLTNSGENIQYYGTSLFNNDVMLDTGDAETDVYFHGCSIDYNTISFIIVGSRVRVIGGHIEFEPTVTDSLLNVSGSMGLLSFSECELLSSRTAPFAVPRLGYNNGTVYFDKVFLHNLEISGNTKYLIENSATAISGVKNTSFYSPVDNTLRGLFSQNLFDNTQAFIENDTAAITTTLVGTNIILARNATANYLDVTKPFGAGSLSAFMIAIPLDDYSKFNTLINFTVAPAWTGSMFLTYYTGRLTFKDDNLPTTGALTTIVTRTVNTGTISTTPFIDYVNALPLKNNTHLFIHFNLASVVGTAAVETLNIETYGI